MRKEIRLQSILPHRNERILVATKEQLKEAYKNLKKVQKQSQELRDTHLDSLAEKRAEQWKLKKKDAALIIKESEKAKKMRKRQKWYLKGHQNGAINHVYIPRPLHNWVPGRDDVQNHQCQMRVDNPDDIFNILLRQNFSQLIK